MTRDLRDIGHVTVDLVVMRRGADNFVFPAPVLMVAFRSRNVSLNVTLREIAGGFSTNANRAAYEECAISQNDQLRGAKGIDDPHPVERIMDAWRPAFAFRLLGELNVFEGYGVSI